MSYLALASLSWISITCDPMNPEHFSFSLLNPELGDGELGDRDGLEHGGIPNVAPIPFNPSY